LRSKYDPTALQNKLKQLAKEKENVSKQITESHGMCLFVFYSFCFIYVFIHVCYFFFRFITKIKFAFNGKSSFGNGQTRQKKEIN